MTTEETMMTSTVSALEQTAPPISVETRVVLVESGQSRRWRVPLALHLTRLFFGALGRLMPESAGRLAERMFFTPRRHRTPAREKEWLRGGHRRDLDVAGHTIATYQWGEGPAVLLVHGWEGRGSQMGAFVDPLVRQGYRVIAFDAPAHGHSSGQRTDAWEVSRIIAELAATEERLHGVVAHSFGAVCVLIAMTEGFSSRRTVLLAPGVESDTFFSGFSEIIGLPEKALGVLRRRVIARFGEDNWSRFHTRHHSETLDKCTERVLLVHDMDDRETPYDDTVALAHWTQNTTLLSTRGLGHRRILRDDHVIDAVTRFVDR